MSLAENAYLNGTMLKLNEIQELPLIHHTQRFYLITWSINKTTSFWECANVTLNITFEQLIEKQVIKNKTNFTSNGVSICIAILETFLKVSFRELMVYIICLYYKA